MSYIKHTKIKKVLILATETTIKANLYSQALIEAIVPDINEQKIITKIIYTILAGKCLKEDMRLLEAIVQKYYYVYSIDGVLLGCTELSLLYNTYQFTDPLSINVTVIDTLDILAQSLLQHAQLVGRVLTI